MLQFKNLHKKERLNNISFTLKKGEIALLLGHSGAGKSTLLRAISHLEPLDQGTLPAGDQIGMVFQHFHLFEHLTAEQNLTLPLHLTLKLSKQESTLRAQALLADYSLSDKAHHLPSQMSGGQKQRLAIARATSMQPKLLCMDEPTSALDPKATSNVAHHIKQLSQKGHSLLIATHDLSLLEKLECSVYLMESGSIIESTPSSQMISQSNTPKIHNFISDNS